MAKKGFNFTLVPVKLGRDESIYTKCLKCQTTLSCFIRERSHEFCTFMCNICNILFYTCLKCDDDTECGNDTECVRAIEYLKYEDDMPQKALELVCKHDPNAHKIKNNKVIYHAKRYWTHSGLHKWHKIKDPKERHMVATLGNNCLIKLLKCERCGYGK